MARVGRPRKGHEGETARRVLELARGGMLRDEIAEILGLSPAGVGTYLRTAGFVREDLLTISEAGKLLGVRRTMIYNLVAVGRLVGVEGNGLRRFPKADVEKLRDELAAEWTERWRIKHGTPNGYKQCRCELCSKSNTKRHAAWKAEARTREPPEHGTTNAYRNWGCRCDECKRAGAEANAADVARRRLRLNGERRSVKR